MKNYMFLFIVSMLFFSCEKEEMDSYPVIKVGTGKEGLTEVNINKFMERKILLSGGNEKFHVDISDSKIAKASINRDTLKIMGLYEGKTFASIKSHDKELILDVNVIPQEISLNQDHIILNPKDLSKFVSVQGGGEVVSMQEIDPNNILDAKWNGETGILEIKANFEGEAKIKFSSTTIKSKEINVTVKSKGSPGKIGIYSTLSTSIRKKLAPLMIVKRKGVGTWLSMTTNPYGISKASSKEVVAKFSVIKKPKVGSTIDLDVSFEPYVNDVSNVVNGVNKVYVEAIQHKTNTVLLRGRGFKIVLPIEK